MSFVEKWLLNDWQFHKAVFRAPVPGRIECRLFKGGQHYVAGYGSTIEKALEAVDIELELRSDGSKEP